MKRLYVLVRRDLGMTQQAVQAGHAVAEWMLRHRGWENEVLVYLRARGEGELLEVAAELEAAGAAVALFREPDRGNEATALAVCDPRAKPIMRSLQLLELGA